MIFVREVGAIDNQTYRQMADCDTLKASTELRMLKSHNLFASKGKGKATYYIPGPSLTLAISTLSTQPLDLSTQPPSLESVLNNVDIENVKEISTPPLNLSTQPPVLLSNPDCIDIEDDKDLSTQPPHLSTPPLYLSTPPPEISTPPQAIYIDESLQSEIDILNQREHDSDKIKGIIMEICKERSLSAKQISGILNKGEDYIKRKYLSEMIKSRQLIYLHPEMINHPEQAYKSNQNYAI